MVKTVFVLVFVDVVVSVSVVVRVVVTTEVVLLVDAGRVIVVVVDVCFRGQGLENSRLARIRVRILVNTDIQNFYTF